MHLLFRVGGGVLVSFSLIKLLNVEYMHNEAQPLWSACQQIGGYTLDENEGHNHQGDVKNVNVCYATSVILGLDAGKEEAFCIIQNQKNIILSDNSWIMYHLVKLSGLLGKNKHYCKNCFKKIA